MKKLLFWFAGIMTAATLLLICSCSGATKRVSERRSEFYSASDGVITVSAVSGVREINFVNDGRAGELKPYTLITLVPATFDVDAVYTYAAKIGDYSFGGTMIQHPFAASYSVEIDVEATEEFAVSVTCNGKNSTLELKSLVTSDMLGFEQAVDVAAVELKPSGEYEIRARIMKNPISGDGLCWHVAFIYADGEASALIDPFTSKIITKKIV